MNIQYRNSPELEATATNIRCRTSVFSSCDFRPYAIVTQKNSTISHPAMLIIDYFRKAFQGG